MEASSARERLGVLAGALLLAALCFVYAVSPAQAVDRTIAVDCTDDIDTVINGDPAGTATLFQLEAGCTHQTSAELQPENGDEIHCATAPTTTTLFTFAGTNTVDPATSCTINSTSAPDNLMKPQGRFFMQGVRITGQNLVYSGTSTGACIAGGQMSVESWVQLSEIRNCPAVGISNAHGIFHQIELNNTTTDPTALGITGSGIKGVDEFVIRHSYIHDNQGNGVWCDVHCDDQSAAAFGDKFHVNANLVVESGRAGIRYERVGGPDNCGSDCSSTPGEALIENNRVAENGWDATRGGIDVRDAQRALVEDNIIGPQTVGGVAYGHNTDNLAIRATDSGRTDRPDLFDIDIVNNDLLSGETITGCILPDTVVFCSNNN